MKAVLCRQYGPPDALTLEEVPSLEPAEGEVIISVHSSAANFPDTLIIEGKYQFKRPFPFVPGGEVAGTIKSVGAGVEGFAPGDRVIGIPGWGGFAEETPVAANKVVQLPDGVSMDAGAALVITYGTTHYALKDREPARFRELMDELTGWLAEGHVNPRITARYPLEDTARALTDLKERKATGKLIVYTDRGRDEG